MFITTTNNHNHEWQGCEHKNLVFCKKCEVPYCKDCGKEWRVYNLAQYTPYSPYYPSTGTLLQATSNTPETLNTFCSAHTENQS